MAYREDMSRVTILTEAFDVAEEVQRVLEGVEVPISFTDRVRGMSKMSLKIIAEEMLLVSWWGTRDRVTRERRNRPT